MIYAIVLVAVYSTGLVAEENRAFVQNLVFLAAPAFALFFGMYASMKNGPSGVQGRTLFIATISLAFWLAGEIIWFIVESILKRDAFPSLADYFYLSAYLIFLTAILYNLKIAKLAWTAKRIYLSALLIAILTAITMYFIRIAYDSGSTAYENFFLISYSLIDLVSLVILVLLLNMSLEFKGGVLSKSSTLLILAFLMTWAGDIMFSVFTTQYEEFSWAYRQIDYLWISFYIFVGYAFFMQAKAVDEIKEMLVKKASSEAGK